jgi:hypothetical protein
MELLPIIASGAAHGWSKARPFNEGKGRRGSTALVPKNYIVQKCSIESLFVLDIQKPIPISISLHHTLFAHLQFHQRDLE